MSDNGIDYLEQLFQGVDILIERKLQDVSYDTTIVCTITDDSNSKNGKYQVTDGTIRFDVYSDSDKYKVKDQVRVSVANSDYSDTKYIVGKYVADSNTQPLTYVSPLDTVVNITGNLVPTDYQSAALIANKSDKPTLDIWSTSLADGRFADLQTNGIYSAITLKADFKTLLHSYNVKSGTYGLRLVLLVKPSKNSAGYIAKTAELSSSEMFGNPYAFSISTEQTKIFDIGTEGLITNIALQLYQNNDFYDTNGNLIPVSLTDNIIVDNIELGFGSDLTAIGDNTVKIYTESDSVYKYQGHTPSPYDRKLGYPNQLNADTNKKRLGVLWYNKNDLNEYIGFSDGIYDADYDEIDYLDLAREDTRLTAHIGREGVPTDKESLELAANIEEAKPLIESASKVITQDLVTMLRALNSQFEGIDDITDHIDESIDTLKGIAIDNDDSIKVLLAKMVDRYAKILAYGKKVQDKDTGTNTWESAWNTDYGKQIKDAFAAVRTNITTLLETYIATQVAEGKAYSGYAGVYDTYKIRLEKVVASMDAYLDENSKHRFPRTVFESYSVTDDEGNTTTYKSDNTRLKSYNQNLSTGKKTNWKSYIKKDLKDYENKYCIYWFRYEKDYVSNEVHQFMPNGWHRLDPDWSEYDLSVPANVGIPGPGVTIDSKIYNEKRLPPGEGMFDIMMRHNEPEERFVAIIFHNHNMYKSDELVFKNADRIPEVANIETGDLLIFKHGERSRDDYQCYNLTNYLMDSADASHNRCIKVAYDGLLNGDEALVGGGLYWYVPTTATMLTFDLEELKSKGFVSDHVLEGGKPVRIDKVKNEDSRKPAPSYSKDGYACFYKQVTAVKDEETNEYNFVNDKQIDSRDFWYKIKPYYDATAVLNSIKCEFRPAEDNDIVTGEQFFSFGIMGSNGTKYTLAITPATNQVATTPSKTLQLDVSLRDFNNEEVDIIKGQTGDGSATGFASEWLYGYMGNKPVEVMSGDKVTGLNALAASCGIVKATVNFQLSSEAEKETEGDVPVTKKRTVQLETVRAIPWAAGDYYISGPTSIVYNSLGTIDNKSMFDNPYKLYALKEVTIGGVTYKSNQEIPVSWERTIHTNDAMDDDARAFYEQYMPVVNDAGGLTPAPMYLDGLDCYLIVHAYTGSGDDKNYLYHQPVVITQNRFGSSVLNDWDGSFTIDEENGTILATMIGAGRKTIENTFEGVLMGDVAIGSNSDIGSQQANDIGLSNHTGLGIYGFNDGAQSFGFNIDGTAFLGKSGRGRIMFNGNYGLIASANWFAGENNTEHPDYDADTNPRPNGGKIGTDGKIRQTSNAGMCIDLDDGHIDAYDFKLTGSRIHFNSHPERYNDRNDVVGHFMRIGNDGETRVDPSELTINDDVYKARKTPGYLAMDADGNLTIRVNSLHMTGALGGTNLLQQTAPKKVIPVPLTNDDGSIKTDSTGEPLYRDENGVITYTWPLDKWSHVETVTLKGTETNEKIDDRSNYLKIQGGDRTISQLVESVKSQQDYTISGYVAGLATAGTLTITINNTTASTHTSEASSPTMDYAVNKWSYFEYTFTTDENVTSLDVQFSANTNFALWHAMLEDGGIASAWSASPKDIEDNVENEQLYYDTYLAQDEIFKKLTTDPNNGQTMVGIWLLPGEESASGHKELYINATYMSTGILRSNNWGGELSKIATNKKDSYGNIIYNYEISKDPTQGLYFNLDTGKMWAANFALYAGTQNTTNYIGLFSTDEYSPTLTIGNSGPLSTWRIVAGSNFGVTKMGTLYAKNADISGDIYASYIEADSGIVGGWKIGEESLYYGAELEKDATVKLNGANGTITLGKNFKATNTGLITATNATLNTMTANTATINNSLTVAAGTGTGNEGNLSVAGTTSLSGNTTIGGTTQINGKLTVGTSSVGANTDIHGAVKIAGNLSVYCGASMTDGSPAFKVVSTGTAADGTGSGMWLTADFVVLSAGKRTYIGTGKDNSWCGINARTQVNGKFAVGQDVANDQAAQMIVKGATEITGKLAIGTAYKADQSYQTLIDGSTNVTGDFYYDSNIYCKNSNKEYQVGKTENFTIKSLTMGTVTFSFINGIFVGGTGGDSSDGGSGTGVWPSIEGNKNKYLQVKSDESGVQWATISMPTGVPSCSTSDNEKCLMVVNGVASWRGSGHTHSVKTLYYDSNGVLYTSQDANNTRTALTLTAQSNNCY